MQGRIEDAASADRRPHVLPVQPAGIEGPRPESARMQYRRLYRLIALTDVLSLAAALLVASWVRVGLAFPSGDALALVLGSPVIVLAVFAMFHLYDAYRYTPAEEFRRIILAVSVSLTGLVTLSFWSNSDFSRLWLALSWTFAVVFALGSRRLWHARVGTLRGRGRLAFPTILVGSNAEARHLAELMDRPSFGFRPVGVVSTASHEHVDTGLPDLGPIADLRELIHDAGAECIFVASSAMSTEEMDHVATAVRLEGVEVRVTATLPEVLSSRLSVQPLGGVTALSLRPVRLTGTQVLAKRVFDLAVSSVGLTILSPLLALMAVSVRLTSPGPVLYRQRRVGLRGRPFTMLKFRTMRQGSDAMVEDLRAAHGVENLMFKLRDDPRVTPAGRILRRFSLDELPQLLNVIRGDMSLVGPRPPLPEEVTRYEDWQFDRLQVPPGITGLWQVSGRSDLTFDDCVRLDLFYIENWSLAYDLYILAKTLPVLVTQRGAY
jgi:exopolysaccharide biosynthesis polyprenyl glycosylphosphotransferase